MPQPRMPGRDEQFARMAREGEARVAELRGRIERTAQYPDEILSVVNCATGVAAGEGPASVLQVVKADGQQLHIKIQPEGRPALIRALQEEEERAAAERDNGASSSGGVVLPGE